MYMVKTHRRKDSLSDLIKTHIHSVNRVSLTRGKPKKKRQWKVKNKRLGKIYKANIKQKKARVGVLLTTTKQKPNKTFKLENANETK